jgi:hypothetical protein
MRHCVSHRDFRYSDSRIARPVLLCEDYDFLMEDVGSRSVHDWLASILRDFSSTAVDTADVRLINLAEVAGGGTVDFPDVASWVDPADPDSPGLLLVVGRNATVIAGSKEGSAEAAAVEIASYLQDIVMDDLNQPWPQVQLQGGTIVLEPRLDDSGVPVWAGRGVICAFGELHSRPSCTNGTFVR